MEELFIAVTIALLLCKAPELLYKELKLSYYKNSRSLLEKAIASTQKCRVYWKAE